MKTIEPNSDSDLINHWVTVNTEFLQYCKNPAQLFNPELTIETLANCESHDQFILMGTYIDLIRMLEKNIKDRELYN